MASIQPVTLPFALCELTPEAQRLGLELSSHVSVKWMNDCLRMERKAWTFGDILASDIYPARWAITALVSVPTWMASLLCAAEDVESILKRCRTNKVLTINMAPSQDHLSLRTWSLRDNLLCLKMAIALKIHLYLNQKKCIYNSFRSRKYSPVPTSPPSTWCQ